jgi:LmbE family N-acetylglucosaminyl deacetylase
MTVLVVAAHPDDEVLGCGGTIAKLSGEGHEIHTAILGEGITSRYNKRESAKMVLVEVMLDSLQF